MPTQLQSCLYFFHGHQGSGLAMVSSGGHLLAEISLFGLVISGWSDLNFKEESKFSWVEQMGNWKVWYRCLGKVDNSR